MSTTTPRKPTFLPGNPNLFNPGCSLNDRVLSNKKKASLLVVNIKEYYDSKEVFLPKIA